MAGHMFLLPIMKLSCIAMGQSDPDITAGLSDILLKWFWGGPDPLGPQ